MKPVKVSFIENAAEEWEKLNKAVADERAKGIKNSKNRQLLKSIKQKIELIRINPQYGEAVSKKLIPRKLPLIICGLSS